MRGRTFRIPEYRYLTPGHAARHPLPRTGEAEGRTCIERAQSCAWLTKGLDGRGRSRASRRRRSTRHAGGRSPGWRSSRRPSLQGAQHPSWRFALSRRSTDRPPRPPPPRPPARLPSRRSPTAPPACWTPTTWTAGARSSPPPPSWPTNTTATSRGGCCWSPSCAPREHRRAERRAPAGRRDRRRRGAGGQPARAGPAQLRRRPALRAGRRRRRRGALSRRPAPGPRAADVAANLRECKRRRAAGHHHAPGPASRRCCARCATSARAPSAPPRSAVPASDQTVSLCMIVKDEEAMLPRCLAAVARARRRADRRRHRLDGPHDRDRRVLRRARPAPRVGRRLLRGPQRRP